MNNDTVTVAHRGATQATTAPQGLDLRRPFVRGLRERIIEAPLFLAALVSVFTTVGIIGVLIFETIEFFREVPLWRFLTETQWTPLFTDKQFGISVLMTATVLTSAGAMVVALPLGLLSAIYLSEYASPWARRTIKPILEILAGIPTVVYGYFALLCVTPILQAILPQTAVFYGASASIV